MKIYTNTFDVSRPSPHRFWVPPYSDFKIGIKLVNAGVELENDFTVAAGTTELIADETKIDGFTIYTLNSTDTGFVEYTITVEGLLQKFKLVQIVSDSTVFDIDERGGDMSQYATKNWVESQISGFVDEDALTAYATYNALSGVNDTAVSALSKAEDAWSSADAALNTVASKVGHTPGGIAPEVLEIMSYYESEYTQLSVDDPSWEPDQNTMYVILPDPVVP